jgi:hypothetical protein
MSRICGTVNWNDAQKRTEHELSVMLRMMWHNPAFQADTHVFENGAFGHVPTTHYPASFLVTDAYHHTSIVFCGYITGWKHLARTISLETNGSLEIHNPAELVAYLLIEHGPDALASLNGIFAFALWRSDEDELFLGGDRYGMRPLYYLHQGRSVLFASEVKAIRFSKGQLTPDYAAFEEMFAFGFLLGDRTFFKEIKRVPPATVFRFTRERMRASRYWWFDEIEINPKLDLDDYIEENRYVFRQAVARLTEDRKSYICLLSAGYDSRRIILELAQAGQKVQAYTFAWGGPDKYMEMDTTIAGQVCEKLGIPHTAIELPDPVRVPALVFQRNIFLDFEADENEQMLPLVSFIQTAPAYNFDGLAGEILTNGGMYWFLTLPAGHRHPPPPLAYTLLSLPRAGESRKLAEIIAGGHSHLLERMLRLRIDAPPLVERVATLLKDLPDSANKVCLFFFLSRTRREVSFLPLGLLSLKVESFLPYLDNDYFAQALSLKPELKIEANPHPQGLILNSTDRELMRIPTSYRLDIYDPQMPQDYSEFYIPLGDYGCQVRKYRLASAERDVLRSPRILTKLSWRSMIKFGAFAMPDHLNILPERYAGGRYWLVQRLAHLANWHRFYEDKAWGFEQLQQARDFVYGR